MRIFTHFSRKFVLILRMAVIAGTAYAALSQRNISVSSGVKIYLNGEEFIPRDVNGDQVDAFIYEGATYLPVRALSLSGTTPDQGVRLE